MAEKSLSLNDKVKRLDIGDIALIKLAVFFFAFALITLFPAVLVWILSVNPWVYVVLAVLASIRPFIRAYLK